MSEARPTATARAWWAMPTAITLVALAVRLGVVAATDHSWKLINDGANYSSIAASIATGRGYGGSLFFGLVGPSAFRTPLYPLMLSPVYWLFGVHPLLARLDDQLFGTLAVAAIGLLARVLFNRRIALVSMAMAAVYPSLLLDSYGLQYETLLVTLTCTAIASAVVYSRNPARTRWLVACGVLTGLGVLTRETAALVLVPLAFLVWRSQRHRLLPTVGRTALVVGLAIAVVAPWTIRNYVALHAFVPVSTDLVFAIEGTYNPTAAHNPQSPTLWVVPYNDPGTLKAFLKTNRHEIPVDHMLEGRALDYIEAHPSYPLEVAAWNTIRMFDLRGFRDELFVAPSLPFDPRLVETAIVTFYVVALAGAVGFCFQEVRSVPWPVWLFPFLSTLATVLVLGILEYRAIIEPYFLMPASVTLVRAFDRRRRPALYHRGLQAPGAARVGLA